MLLAGSAFAQDSDTRARELYENGTILYEEGRYEDAIVAWEEAYRLSSRHALLYNIANAHERMGNYEEAIDTLGRYRAYAPASERDVLDRRLRNIERRMIEEGGSSGSSSGTSGSGAAGSTTTEPVVPREPRVRSDIDVLPIGLLGVGAVALGTGAAMGIRSSVTSAQLETVCIDGVCPSTADGLLTTNQRSAIIADVGFVVGTAAAATGVVVLVMDERLLVAPTPGGLMLEGRW